MDVDPGFAHRFVRTLVLLFWAGAALHLPPPGESGSARAAGYFLEEQTGSGLATAFAGRAALADDASVLFYNPAGIALLDGPQLYLAGNAVFARAVFANGGSTVDTPASGGAAGTGNIRDNPLEPQVYGDIYAAIPIPWVDGLWAGLAVTTPFEVNLNYHENWFGRYDSTRTRLFTVDIAPSVAYRVNDWISIGAAVDIQVARATLKNNVPNPLVPTPSAATDGRARLEGDSVSAGFNLGLHLRPIETLRLGLSYRYGVRHTLKGDASLTGLEGAASGANFKSSAKAGINLPDIVMLGVAWQASDNLQLLGEVNWYRWSAFDKIDARIPGQNNQEILLDWKNTFSVSLGGEYRFAQDWLLRGGFQFDQTPTIDRTRSSRAPDANRYMLAAGIEWDVFDWASLQFSYAHIFLEEVSINRADRFESASRPGIVSTAITRANVASGADIVSFGLIARY